jgi:hypothetical protein
MVCILAPLTQQQGARVVQRRRRHALVLHAAYPAGVHRLQERRLQLWRHLWDSTA